TNAIPSARSSSSNVHIVYPRQGLNASCRPTKRESARSGKLPLIATNGATLSAADAIRKGGCHGQIRSRGDALGIVRHSADRAEAPGRQRSDRQAAEGNGRCRRGAFQRAEQPHRFTATIRTTPVILIAPKPTTPRTSSSETGSFRAA